MAERAGSSDWRRFEHVRPREAAERLLGVVTRTPLAPLVQADARIELRVKLENRQQTGSFKARGAWNQVSLLSAEERARGVVCTSSGNHGRALAWAAARAGVPATILMPADAYPNKIEACRALGAEVELGATRAAAEARCDELVAAGRVLVHPYAAERTIQGAGTVGLEIAEDWPEVEVVVFPVGGGGLISGGSLALRQELGAAVRVLGAEPAGAPSLTRGLEAGDGVVLEEITTQVQGLCPLSCGRINVEICGATLDGVELLSDAEILAGQARLVRSREVVEPAGGAAVGLVLAGRIPAGWLAGRSADDPLRVAAVVSGGNPDPAQLERLRAALAEESQA